MRSQPSLFGTPSPKRKPEAKAKPAQPAPAKRPPATQLPPAQQSVATRNRNAMVARQAAERAAGIRFSDWPCPDCEGQRVESMIDGTWVPVCLNRVCVKYGGK